MKLLLSFLFFITVSAVSAREKIPVIRATSDKATICLENAGVKAWRIDPRESLDVFFTPKMSRPEYVLFRTDSDSIRIRLEPGAHVDFIVVLGGKDSCRTRIQSPVAKDFSHLSPEIHDTVVLNINEHNTIYVKSVLNDTDTLRMNFDSGASDIVLTEDALQHKIRAGLQLYHTKYALRIGNREYKAPVFPAALSGHGTDGRFGWDLFDGYILELDYDKHIMVVHSRMPARVLKQYTALRIKYMDNVFLVESSIAHGDTTKKSWFLFDTGYERTAMLDADLLKEDQFPEMELIRKVMMKGAKGNEIPVITSRLETLSLGKYKLKSVPVQVQTANKPMQGLNIHILGNEVLKRFNAILDFQHNMVYLKPNKHFDDPYIEQ